MSYTILYDRQFVEVNGSFLMVILSGSNNCTEFNSNGNEILARDWGALSDKNKVLFTAEEVVAFAKTTHEWEIGKSRNTKYTQEELERYIINGMKYAQPLEFFIENRITYKVCTGTYPDLTTLTVKTTAELEAACVMATLQGVPLHFMFYETEKKWPKVRVGQTEGNNFKEGTDCYVLQRKRGEFVSELTEKSLSYCKRRDEAIVLKTEGEKTAYLEVNQKYMARWGVTMIKAQLNRFQPIQGFYVVKGHMFIVRSASKRGCDYCYDTESAKKFRSEKDAQRFLVKYPHLVEKYEFKPLFVDEVAYV